MSNILEEVLDINWFISVVVVGIAINIISAYLKNPLDRFLAARSKKQRKRIEKEHAEIEENAKKIASDSTLIIIEGQRNISLSLESFSHFAMLIVLFLSGLYIQEFFIGPKTFIETKIIIGLSFFVGILTMLILVILSSNRQVKHGILLARAEEIYKSTKA
jgi:hypothetical protein